MTGKRYRKITALLLTMSMLLGGCSGMSDSNGEQKPEDNALMSEDTGVSGEETYGVNLVAEDGSWLGEGGCYRLKAPDLDEKVYMVEGYQGDIYSFTMDWAEETMISSVYRGDELVYETNFFIEGAAVGQSGIWMTMDVSDYSVSDARRYQLNQISSDGSDLQQKEITQQIVGSYLLDMEVDLDGRVMLLLERDVIVLNEEGSPMGSIHLEYDGGYLILGGDGLVYVVAAIGGDQEGNLRRHNKAGGQIFKLDLEEMTAQPVTEYNEYRISNGGEGYLFTLLNGEGLYGVTSAGENMEPVAVWSELGLAFSNPQSIRWMQDGSILIQDTGMRGILYPVEPREIKPKTVITVVGVEGLSVVSSQVAEFNMNNDDYVVKLKDYSKNGEMSAEDGLVALNTDIMAGKYPDVFYMFGIPESYYGDKGLLEDIYHYLDNDQDVGRDDFMFLDKLEDHGSLYCVMPSYYVETAVGLESRFMDSQGVTLDDYMELQKQYSGEIMYNVTREGFLTTQVYRYAAHAVDWKEGTCDFESEDFIRILEASSQVRENPEPQNSNDLNYTPAGRRLAEGSLILAYWFIDNVKSLAEAEAEAKEPLKFVGLPTPDGTGGTRLQATGGLGICSRGQKEGAWEFLKYMMTEGAERISAYGISINKAQLERQIADAIADEEDAIQFTQEDAEKFYDFLDTAVYYGEASQEVVNIVMEEAVPFLEGARNAEETAHIIQSRVGILVAE